MKKIEFAKGVKKSDLQKILDKYKYTPKRREVRANYLVGYREFSKSQDAYTLASKIHVTVCPYCNEQYIFTIPKFKDDKIQTPIRPEFDHFSLKSSYPELALDLENLVPSCHVCNCNLKKIEEFNENTHLNPYKDDFDSILKFQVILNESWNLNYCDENSFEIKLVPHKNKIENKHDNKRAYNNARVFRIEDRYRFHKNEVIKILKMMKYYTSFKQKEIANILGINDVYLFKNILFLDINCDINNTSLGKLKRDITRNFI